MLNTVPPALSRLWPPAWVHDLVQNNPDRFALTSCKVIAAEHLSDCELQAQTRCMYENILNKISSLNEHPVRFWNNVPQLTFAASEQRNRYMVFNAGRYEALKAFYGDASHFDASMPAATAVDAGGGALEIYCLSANAPPLSVNNPRQVAPYHYSRRFGPLPPCFARAVKLQWPANRLIVGGTAAIRGEDSVYREDLARQLNETIVNLSALIGAAKGDLHIDKNPAAHVAAYRELRVYFPNAEHENIIRQTVHATFPDIQHLEMVVADLCRPELLVEIEGVAELPI